MQMFIILVRRYLWR